ncbi:hypothetical protein OAG60_01960 [bacterium]|nr:hypothetical protein [bacterium]
MCPWPCNIWLFRDESEFPRTVGKDASRLQRVQYERQHLGGNIDESLMLYRQDARHFDRLFLFESPG